MGTSDGSIIATIIRTHIAMKVMGAPSQLCPGIRIHAIDIVQPPGIGIPPIADIDTHQNVVSVALTTTNSPETPTTTASSFALTVLIVGTFR